jgi:hypothetical protein
MILFRLGKLCICFAMFLGSVIYAAEVGTEPVEQTGFLPAQSTHANWVFSGMVMNESGEHYAYFFQMQRHGNDFHVVSALFDAQTKALVLMDEGDASIKDPELNNWHVGRSFLRFNAINDSWIFGLKTHDKKGFNFKVDMLNQPEHNPVVQGLRAGVEAIVSPTGQLNGHVQVGNEGREQFVSAKNAWFRQIWISNAQTQSHQLTSVLCRFDDGSGFYSMNMLEPDAVRGAVAGWFDAQGMPSAMSQFINVKEEPDGSWHIRVTSPNLHLTLSDAIKQRFIVAGFVTEKDQQGFCVLNKDSMGEGTII